MSRYQERQRAHKAYIQGVAAGIEGVPEDENPYAALATKKEWQRGYAVGWTLRRQREARRKEDELRDRDSE